ncbi:MAG: acyl-CoA synthetase [Magnetococcales bacterium]|nr:acyl-CoA synthetase [Magnetococcales bacterium]
MLPHTQPGLLASLTDQFDFLLSDDATLAGARLPVLAPDHTTDHACPTTLDNEDGVVEFFTSGSTGQPKRVVRKWSQMLQEVAVLEHVWGGMAGLGPTLSTVPHHHVFGLTFAVLWPLLAGRPFFANGYPFLEELIRDLPRNGVIVSSPAHLGRMAGLTPIAQEQTPRLLFSAGAPLSAQAAQQCHEILGVAVNEIYGSTETGAMATRCWSCNTPEGLPWHPLPGLQMEIDPTGRLTLLSPYVSHEWVATGDQAVPAPNGGFTLRGRLDRIVKVEGKRVGLSEVENCLSGLPHLDQAAVILLNQEQEATLAAVAVPSTAGWERLQQVGAFRFGRELRQELAGWLEPAARPRRWRFLAALPTDPLGKVRATDLERLFSSPSLLGETNHGHS